MAWREGNGQSLGVPDPTAGTGQGATWTCTRDPDIADPTNRCFFEPWDGGNTGQSAFGPKTAPGQAHVNGASGDVEWDVAKDVRAGHSEWLIKKTSDSVAGEVDYRAKENAGTPPRLVLELSGNQ